MNANYWRIYRATWLQQRGYPYQTLMGHARSVVWQIEYGYELDEHCAERH